MPVGKHTTPENTEKKYLTVKKSPLVKGSSAQLSPKGCKEEGIFIFSML